MDRNKKAKKPRKITCVKPSKFEAAEAVQENKKYWNKVFEKIDTIHKEPTVQSESERLSLVLPDDLYEKVCRTLDMPVVKLTNEKTPMSKHSTPKCLVKEPLLSYRKSVVIYRDLDSDTDVEISSGDEPVEDDTNIHYELLSKPEREQITWATKYLQPEREDEKTLVRKADDLTDRIAQEFCEYMKQLGGDQQSQLFTPKAIKELFQIAQEFCEYMKQLGGDQQSQLFTPKAIKELFQIEFDTHVARSLRVIPKEMPSVIENVAQHTGNPEQSKYAVLEREVLKDLRAERRADRVQAFGRRLPRQDQWRAPNNDTKNLWRSARHVPKDLVTLKAVWEGITNLRSVKEYCRWMIAHPEHRRAPYLSSLGMFDAAVLEARLTFEAQPDFAASHKHESNDMLEETENIRKKLS